MAPAYKEMKLYLFEISFDITCENVEGGKVVKEFLNISQESLEIKQTNKKGQKFLKMQTRLKKLLDPFVLHIP